MQSRSTMAVILPFSLLFLLPPDDARAQVDDAAPSEAPSSWLVGGSIGLPGFNSDLGPVELLTVGFNVTNAGPNRPGVDFAAVTIPRFFAEGVAVVGIRTGVAAQLGTGSIQVWPSAGFSALAATAGGAIGGGYLGAALTFFDEEPVSTRLGVTLHKFNDTDEMLWLIELGFLGAEIDGPAIRRGHGARQTKAGTRARADRPPQALSDWRASYSKDLRPPPVPAWRRDPGIR